VTRVAIIAACAVAASASAIAAQKPIAVSVGQLVSAPQRFAGKPVEVTGFFDPQERGFELRAHRGDRKEQEVPFTKSLFVDLTQQQINSLIRKHQFRRGQVRVIARFEYSPQTPDRVVQAADPRNPRDRTIVERWQGFGPFYTCQLTAISLFEPI
jgi:hypothetical protein